MQRDLSLAHLTVLSLPPPEMVRVAARTGFRAVGLRLIAVTEDSPGYPLMNDALMRRETAAALADTALRLLDIEFVKITPEIDVAALEPFIAAGAALGARHLITAPYDSDHARLSDRLGAIAKLAEPYGLSALLEFFPLTTVPDLATAAKVVEGASSTNTGILLDTLHFDRSGSSLDLLESLPRSRGFCIPRARSGCRPGRAASISQRYSDECRATPGSLSKCRCSVGPAWKAPRRWRVTSTT